MQTNTDDIFQCTRCNKKHFLSNFGLNRLNIRYKTCMDCRRKTQKMKVNCSVEDCGTTAVQFGLCVKHGGRGKCKVEDCQNLICNKGVCVRHGADKVICTIQGCTNSRKKDGFCVKHGAVLKKCIEENCKNNAQNNSVCFQHGAHRKTCMIENCTSFSVNNNLCQRHGAQKQYCSVDGCDSLKRSKNEFCYHHQPNKELHLKCNAYEKLRTETDPQFKIKKVLRSRICKALKAQHTIKNSRTQDLTGCTIQELFNHIESLFTTDMNWENHGEWHIDHIKACATYDLTDPEEQKKCFHYTNLQPLWAKDNLKKGKY